MTTMRNLMLEREFRVYIPDITQAEVKKNQPHLLKIVLPMDNVFLEVLQIEHPLSGVTSGLGKLPKVMGYAFHVNPKDDRMMPFYITSVFSDAILPWPKEPYNDGDLSCRYLGVTTHNGIPIFHIQTVVNSQAYKNQPSGEVIRPARPTLDVKLYEVFEVEVMEMGYKIVNGKPYELNKQLLNFYRAQKPNEVVPEEKPTSEPPPERAASGE